MNKFLTGDVQPAVPLSSSLYDIFDGLASKEDTANKTALVSGDVTLSFKEVKIMVNSISSWILSHLQTIKNRANENKLQEGCKKSGKVIKPQIQFERINELDHGKSYIAVCLNRTSEHVAVILALWKLHMVYVPIDPQVLHFRTIGILQQLKPSLIICDSETSKALKELIHKPLPKDTDQNIPFLKVSETIDIDLETFINRLINLDNWKSKNVNWSPKKMGTTIDVSNVKEKKCLCSNPVVLIMFTSGSTGFPKGFKIKKKNLYNRLKWQWDTVPFEENDYGIWYKPVTFIDSLTELMSPLLSGNAIVVVEERVINPELVIKYVNNYPIRRFSIIPSFLKILLQYLDFSKEGAHVLGRIRLWIASGESLPSYLVTEFFRQFQGVQLINFYGLTEVTGDVSFHKVSKDLCALKDVVPLGIPIYNTALFIAKHDDMAISVAEENEVGEIMVISLNNCEDLRDFSGDVNIEEQTFIPISSIHFINKKDAKFMLTYFHKIWPHSIGSYEVTEQNGVIPNSGLFSQKLGKQFHNPWNFSTSGTDIPNRKMRSSSVCSSTAFSTYGNKIIVDEIELLNKFKTLSYHSQLNEPSKLNIRRGSMPHTEVSPIEERERSRSPYKEKFKTNHPKISGECKTGKPMAKRSGDRSHSVSSSDFFDGMGKATSKSSSQQFLSLSFSRPTSLSVQEIQASANISSQFTSKKFFIIQEVGPFKCEEKMYVCRTGDIGRISQGILHFEGREDSQFKIQGFRINLQEVEFILKKSRLIEDCHISVFPSAKYEQSNDKNLACQTKIVKAPQDVRNCYHKSASVPTEESLSDSELKHLVAFVILKDGKDSVSESLLQYMRQCLPVIVIPKIVVVDQIPLLPNGKVDEVSLVETYETQRKQFSKDAIFFANQKDEPIESRVIRIISTVLGVSPSQELLKKNFFEAGGTSFNTVEVICVLHDAGFDIGIEAFLQAPSIAHVVNSILKAKTRAEVVTLFSPCPSPRRRTPQQILEKTRSQLEELNRLSDELIQLDVGESSTSDKKETASSPYLKWPPLNYSIDDYQFQVSEEESNPVYQFSTIVLTKDWPGSPTDIIQLVARAFVAGNPLDKAVGSKIEDYNQFLLQLWPSFMEDELSLIVSHPTKGVVGAMLTRNLRIHLSQCFSHGDLPSIFSPTIALYEHLENRGRNALLESSPNSKWANNIYLAVDASLGPQESVRLTLQMEKKLISHLITKGFTGIFTINSNRMNQLLCHHFLGYEEIDCLCVSTFEHEGKFPFSNLPEGFIIKSMKKSFSQGVKIRNENYFN